MKMSRRHTCIDECTRVRNALVTQGVMAHGEDDSGSETRRDSAGEIDARILGRCTIEVVLIAPYEVRSRVKGAFNELARGRHRQARIDTRIDEHLADEAFVHDESRTLIPGDAGHEHCQGRGARRDASGTAGFLDYAVTFGNGSFVSWNPAIQIDWLVTIVITIGAVAGALVGSSFVGRVHPDRLRKAFGWFVLVMAFFILSQELGATIIDFAGDSPVHAIEVLVGLLLMLALMILFVRWPAKAALNFSGIR